MPAAKPGSKRFEGTPDVEGEVMEPDSKNSSSQPHYLDCNHFLSLIAPACSISPATFPASCLKRWGTDLVRLKSFWKSVQHTTGLLLFSG